MTKALKWRIAILLVIVFLAGVATGIFGAANHARQIFGERRSAHVGERMRERFKRELQLTPEQSEKISPIFDQMTQRLDVIREETSKRVRDTMVESHQQMVPLLNPAQREKMEKMRKRHHRMMHLHGPPSAPDSPNDPR